MELKIKALYFGLIFLLLKVHGTMTQNGMSGGGTSNEDEMTDGGNLPDECNHTIDEGTNANASSPLKRYAFNLTSKKCQSFVFKGNAGNENIFKSFDLCKRLCEESPKCDVLSEYIEGEEDCVVENKCLEKKDNNCTQNEICVKTKAGHFECKKEPKENCPSGYKREDKACHDIDECSQTKKCHSIETCFNYPGNFVCVPRTCPKGYFFKSYPEIPFNCEKKNLTCSEQNLEKCLMEPMYISSYYTTFSKNLKLSKTGGTELWKMRPKTYIDDQNASVNFTINYVFPEVFNSSFDLKYYGTDSQNVGLILTKSVDASQTINIEVIMNIYYNITFIGCEKANFTIFVSEI